MSDSFGIKYIGQTKRLKRRIAQHNSFSNNLANRPVCQWITKLLTNGEHPIFNIIEETHDLDDREKYWIKNLKKQGIKLLNMTDGGDSMVHLRRAKKYRPWGYSPIQRRLSDMCRTAKMLQRMNQEKSAQKIYANLQLIIQKLSGSGIRDKVNQILWARYGY